jgi:hypothetical protein
VSGGTDKSDDLAGGDGLANVDVRPHEMVVVAVYEAVTLRVMRLTPAA